jgi:hypothetical protein
VRLRSQGEHGAITAEWVVALPALVAVAALLTGGLGAGIAHHRLHQHASDHARVLGLGGDPGGLPPVSTTASYSLSHREDLVCVHYADIYDAGWWALSPLALSSTACALDPGFAREG